MQATTQKRLNKMMAAVFMLCALVITLLVGLQGRAEGKGWLSSIFLGAVAGVLISYVAVMLLLAVVTVVRRVSSRLHKR